MSKSSLCLVTVLMPSLLCAAEGISGPQPVRSVQQQADGVMMTLGSGRMAIRVCTDDIVHVQTVPGDQLPTTPSYVVTAAWKSTPFTVQDATDVVTLTTKRLRVQVDKRSSAVRFLDTTGNVVLAEQERSFQPGPVATGDGLGRVEQTFATRSDELLYGLGQFQDGLWDWRGIPLELRQHNTVAAFPMLVSSKGYGVLWDNASLTWVNPADQTIPLTSADADDANAPKATEELTKANKAAKKGADRVGQFTTTEAGEYVFVASNGDRRDRLEVLVNGQRVAGLENMWVPYTVSGVVTLPARTTVSVTLRGGGARATVAARPRQIDRTVFRSQAGGVADYWFFYGPQVGNVIADYRQATGAAPMWPKWAFGFWQCRERYSSSKQLVDTIAEFRKQRIPVDLIVQDWQYWGKYGWGAYQWDEKHYPDPAALCKDLHDLHAHFMVSVWPNPSGTAKAKLASLPHGFIKGSGVYDATDPQTRKVRWDLLNEGFFSRGVDSWWQDAAEPLDDGNTLGDRVTAMGPGAVHRNAYTLFHNQSVYDGQRSTTNDKRVVTLTRSAYPGQQRYATALWSGDINGTWDSFRRQIPAGLHISLAGLPYWTTDCGGFFHPKNQYASADYNELWARWFQYSTLCPIQRVHGYQTETEVWKWQPKTQEVMRAFLAFRYRLLPYLYSQAWAVTSQSDTMMRPLVMDFAADSRACAIGDQYLLGPAMLVSPVTEPKATTRQVYLPSGTTWFDFWDGSHQSGGQNVTCAAPIERLPVQVRAGSIIPLGPDGLQYADEKPADPLEIRVYPGADGSFTLYEDAGDGYAYEKGEHSTITFTWNDKTRKLTIGARTGRFPGMLERRNIRVVLVRNGIGGVAPVARPDATITYSGSAATVTL